MRTVSQRGLAAKSRGKRQTLMAGWPPHGVLAEGAERGTFETKGKRQKWRADTVGRVPDLPSRFRALAAISRHSAMM